MHLLGIPTVESTNFRHTKINQIIFNVMWNERGDKIKRDIVITNYDVGGLNIPHFQKVCTSQNITWVKR